MNIKVVVGAGYGDEGKGLMTDYFCEKLKNQSEFERVLNVKVNGGAQAGHTVCRLDKGSLDYKHWVFRQLGSGTFVGADTYLLDTFMVNFIELLKEFKGIKDIYGDRLKGGPKVFIDRRCRVTLPMDILMNRLIEDTRSQRHGSCGLGIYETFHRNNTSFALSVNDILKKFTTMSLWEFEEYLNNESKDYYELRVDELRRFEKLRVYDSDIQDIIEKTKEMNKELISTLGEIGTIRDIAFVNNLDELYERFKYNNIVFECSQGLELDMRNTRNWPHLTPSNTGLANVRHAIINSKTLMNKEDKRDMEVCFVTRSYKTKHGAGEFIEGDDEVRELFNLYDSTNQTNAYQGELRYGRLNIGRLKNLMIEQLDCLSEQGEYKVSLGLTHLDQTNNLLVTTKGQVNISDGLKPFEVFVENVHMAFGPKASDIIELPLKK